MKITGTHLGIAVIVLFFVGQCFAGPEHNHVHIEQVADGDNVNINIDQIGYDNHIDFTFAHAGNSFDLSQTGNGNSISWVSYWGSGKAWGGDLDGNNNTLKFEQYNTTGSDTYGATIMISMCIKVEIIHIT